MEAPSPSASRYRITIPARRASWFLGIVVAVLALVNVVLQTAHYRGYDLPYDLRYIFDVDNESSIPTWFSSSGLLISSLLLLAIAGERRREGDRDARYWYGLALGFAVMSLDEIAALHELANTFMDIDWTIPGAILVAILAALYLRFLLRLDRQTRQRFVTAGAVYLAGALGVEYVMGEPALFRHSMDSLPYQLLATVEETLEMVGIVLFIHTFLVYMSAAPSFLAATVEVGVQADARPDSA